ncbi:hypothetical protein HDV00_004103 [Rhizophlyctis rosea]|nr:hypothetical protein HDV00_004103 [Rhizophlyctis rosea]
MARPPSVPSAPTSTSAPVNRPSILVREDFHRSLKEALQNLQDSRIRKPLRLQGLWNLYVQLASPGSPGSPSLKIHGAPLRDHRSLHKRDVYTNLLKVVASAARPVGSPENIRLILHDMTTAGYSLTTAEWDRLISAYGRANNLQGVEQSFSSMRQSGIIPSTTSYEYMIQAFGRMGLTAKALESFEHMLAEGVPPSSKTYENLIHAYLRAGDLPTARKVFDQLQQSRIKPTPGTLALLITAYASAKQTSQAAHLYNIMIDLRIRPSLRTLTQLLVAFARQSNVEAAKLVHQRLLYFGIKPDLVFYTALINLYAKKKDMQGCLKLLGAMHADGITPDEPLYNVLIKGYGDVKDLGAARLVYDEMIKRAVAPTVVTFTALINAHLKVSDFDGAMDWVHCMNHSGSSLADEVSSSPTISPRHPPTPPTRITPDAQIFTTIMDGYAKTGDLDRAESIFEQMIASGINPDVPTYTVLIHGYSSRKDLPRALTWFDRLLTAHRNGQCAKPDQATYNCIIAGYVSMEDLDAARDWMGRMAEARLELGASSYAIVIGHHLKQNRLDKAVEVYDEMCREGVAPSTHIYVSLIVKLGQWVNSSWKPVHDQAHLEKMRGTELRKHSDTFLSRMKYHDTLARIYEDYRRAVPRLRYPLFIGVYDTVIAHLSRTWAMSMVVKVFYHSLEDGCTMDEMVVVRVCTTLCRREGWGWAANWGLGVLGRLRREAARAGISAEEVLKGDIGEDIAGGSVSITEMGHLNVEGGDEEGDGADQWKSFKYLTREGVLGVEKFVTAAVCFSFGWYGFAGAWRVWREDPDWRRTFDVVGGTFVKKAAQRGGRWGFGGDVWGDEEYVKGYWDGAVRCWKTFEENQRRMNSVGVDHRQAATDDTMYSSRHERVLSNSSFTFPPETPPAYLNPRNPHLHASHNPQRLPIPLDAKLFATFCKAFLRHCELNGLWDARRYAVEWLVTEGWVVDAEGSGWVAVKKKI